jgi:hypothetical protein
MSSSVTRPPGRLWIAETATAWIRDITLQMLGAQALAEGGAS